MDLHNVVIYFILGLALAVLSISYFWQRKNRTRTETASQKIPSSSPEKAFSSATTPLDLKLPSPADLREQRATAHNLNERQSRDAFMSVLASVKQQCLDAIEKQYVQNLESLVMIPLPREMWKRRDLIDSQIVSWLCEQGWSARHKWGTISNNYYLFISPR